MKGRATLVALFMRRMTQVRLTDWAVRILVTVTFFAFFFAPSQWVFPLVLVCFAAVGLWGILYPEGVLGWAKTAHPSIDVNDSSTWWIPRLIGAFFLFFVVALALASRAGWR
jgi:hypothetical protein